MTRFEMLHLVRQAASSIIDVIDDYHNLRQENKQLKDELKQYKDLIYQDATRPHPAEAILTLMNEGHMTLHPKNK